VGFRVFRVFSLWGIGFIYIKHHTRGSLGTVLSFWVNW
jgi:hypothetical protein